MGVLLAQKAVQAESGALYWVAAVWAHPELRRRTKETLEV